MAAVGKLDRRAKTAVTGLVLVIIAILGLVIRNSVVSMTPDATVAAPIAENQDELIQIGRHTLLLEHGSAGNRIAHWLHAGSKNAEAFEMSNQSFVANSDALSPEGERRVGLFAQMMNHVRALNAQVYMSSDERSVQLELARATHLRQDMVSRGIPPARVSVSNEPVANGKALSKEPELVVVLSE